MDQRFFLKRIVSVVLAFTLIAGLSGGMGMTVKARGGESPQRAGERKWTIGIYLCGADLESMNKEASDDIIEILEADVPADFSEHVEIIIQTGGSTKWHYKELYGKQLKRKELSDAEIDRIIPNEIDADKIQRYRIDFAKEYETDEGETATVPALEYLGDVGENNPENSEDAIYMGDEQVFSDFLTFLKEAYPAEHMALDFWNHGGGVTGGVCYDDYSYNPLTLQEMMNGFGNNYESEEDRLDLVGFDACNMSNYEIWNKLSAYVDYGVGSLTSEPGGGWYYTPFISNLGKSYDTADGKELGSNIVSAYEEYYKEGGEDEYDNPEAMLCVVDLMRLAVSAQDFDKLSELLLLSLADQEGAERIKATILKKDIVESNTCFAGLQGFLDILKEESTKRSQEIKASGKSYERYLSSCYDQIVELAERIETHIFTGENSAVIAAYDGWETSQNKGQGAMSIFYQEGAVAADNYYYFNLNTYPNISVSDNYAKYMFYVAKGVEDRQYLEYDTEFSYQGEEGFKISVAEENAIYTNCLGAQRWMEKEDGYYLMKFDKKDAASTFDVPVDRECLMVLGVPVFFELYDGGSYKMYNTQLDINGVSGTAYFLKMNNENEISFYEFEPDDMRNHDESRYVHLGDVIDVYAICCPEMEYLNGAGRKEKSEVKVSHTVSSEDLKDEEDQEYTIRAELTELSPSEIDFCLVSVSNTVEGNFYRHRTLMVNYQDILDYAAATATLENSKYELTGEAVEPKVSLKSETKEFVQGTDYEVSYCNNLGVGTASAIVSGLGEYACMPDIRLEYTVEKMTSGEEKVKVVTEEVIKVVPKEVEKVVTEEVVKVVPKEVEKVVTEEVIKVVTKEVSKIVTKVVIVKAPAAVKWKKAKRQKAGSVSLVWKKSKNAKGYQVSYALNRKFKNAKKKMVAKTSVKVSGLKKKKTYYVKVRAYAIAPSGGKVYGSWSDVKKVVA